VRIRGDVPLVLTETKDVFEALAHARTPVEEVYGQIIQDLSEAAADSPGSYTGVDVGRATSGAAQTLLGKVYLTRQQYPEAVQTLETVIHSGAYVTNKTLVKGETRN